MLKSQSLKTRCSLGMKLVSGEYPLELGSDVTFEYSLGKILTGTLHLVLVISLLKRSF